VSGMRTAIMRMQFQRSTVIAAEGQSSLTSRFRPIA
jgi:hypothetical protein